MQNLEMLKWIYKASNKHFKLADSFFAHFNSFDLLQDKNSKEEVKKILQ